MANHGSKHRAPMGIIVLYALACAASLTVYLYPMRNAYLALRQEWFDAIGARVPIPLPTGEMLANPLPWAVLFLASWIALIAFFKWQTMQAGYAKAPKKGATVFAFILAAMLVVGQSYHLTSSWDMAFGGPARIARSVFLICGLALLLRSFVLFAFSALDGLSQPRKQVTRLPRLVSAFEAHPYLCSFAAIALCWGAALAVMLPGSIGWDAIDELAQYEGLKPRLDAHPWFATMLLGVLFDTGRAMFGSDNGGLLFAVIVQSLACNAVYSTIVATMEREALPRGAVFATLAFFALTPTWASYAQLPYKDTLFAACFALMLLCAALLLRDDQRCRAAAKKQGEESDGAASSPAAYHPSWKLWVGLCAAALFTSLLRKNGLYAAAVLAVGMFVLLRTEKGRVAVVAAVVAACTILGDAALAPTLGFAHAGSREILALPDQMVARYLRDYPADITDEQRQALAAYFDVDNAGALYDPNLADPVKNTVNYDMSQETADGFVRTWAELFWVHPDAYFQAAINASYGYFFPSGMLVRRTEPVYFNTIGEKKYLDQFDFERMVISERACRMATLAITASGLVAGWGLVLRCGTYVWALLILFAYALSRRKKAAVVVALPCLITLLVCMLSPVNGCVRYFLPVMASLPVLLLCLKDAPLQLPANEL